MRKPTPVTMSIITPLRASMLNFTSMGTLAPPEPPVVCIHSHAFHTSLTCSPLASSASCASARKAATEAAKLTPTAVSAINRTASLPRVLPQTPFTKAPSNGIPRMTAMRR